MHFFRGSTSCTLCWLETSHGISIVRDTSKPREIWPFVPHTVRNPDLSGNCLTVRGLENLFRLERSIVFKAMNATQLFWSYQRGMEAAECLASFSKAFPRNMWAPAL